MNKFILLILLLLSACSPDTSWHSLPVLVNAKTLWEKNILNDLNFALGCEYFSIDSSGVEISYPEVLTNSPAPTIGHVITGWNEVKEDEENFIIEAHIEILASIKDREIYRNVLGHELFHVLGFRHHSSSGLMAEQAPINIPIKETINEEMREFLAKFYECK